ncbi:hypothetical protein F5X97DRAFT_123774 [Nemania serpens]|nr:hypothetical protein F5X97DRAFT_123774 [Nemania serpens]
MIVFRTVGAWVSQVVIVAIITVKITMDEFVLETQDEALAALYHDELLVTNSHHHHLWSIFTVVCFYFVISSQQMRTLSPVDRRDRSKLFVIQSRQCKVRFIRCTRQYFSVCNHLSL